MTGALSHFRICDFTGQLAGAGATKWLAAFGAEVIRIEDPVRQGRWDILRGNGPFVDDRRGIDMGGGFNNHNTDKKGITLNLRTDKGKKILTEIIKKSDAVTENFAAGVLGTNLVAFSACFLLAALVWTPLLVGLSMAAGMGAESSVGTLLQWGPFGGLALFSLLGAWHQDRRKLALGRPEFKSFYQGTSMLPFAHSGAWRGLLELPPILTLGALGTAAGVYWLHGIVWS